MLVVNGKAVDVEGPITVAALLRRMGFVFPLLVVRVNGVLVDRADYERALAPEGAEVEVVHLMSGG